MFGTPFLQAIPPDQQETFWTHVEKAAKPLEREGKWHADYRRLRIVAIKT
jgi:hypothetical protein